jgi:hypothetical protein
MKYLFIYISIFLFLACVLINYVSIENLTTLTFAQKNKEYMDMLISMTSIFGGIFVIIAIMALSRQITVANPPKPKPYSSRST